MKKVILAAVAALMFNTSAQADDGTIKSILVGTDVTAIVLQRTDGSLAYSTLNANISGDLLKTFMATALTAKASNSPVTMYWDAGWKFIQIK